MPNYAYINGTIVPAAKAVIPINDLGLLRGYAVFDYLRTYNGKPLLINHHFERFENSAKSLRIALPLTKKQITETIISLIQKSKIKKDVGIRLLITGGNSTDGISLGKPNFIIIIEDLAEPKEEEIKNGVKLIINKFQRETPLVKTTNYKNAIRHSSEKEEQNAYDILYHFNNNILETTRNNFFIFKKNILLTAKEKVLQGITRKIILQIAKEKFKIEERPVNIDELKDATEAFVTGATKNILPVVQINKLKIGNGKIGKNTKILIKMFRKYIRNCLKIQKNNKTSNE